MSDVHDQRIFSAEQIEVPDDFPGILKNLIKAVVKEQPEDNIKFARQYFEDLYRVRLETEEAKMKETHYNFYLEHDEDIRQNYKLFDKIGDKNVSRTRRGISNESAMPRAVKIVHKKDLEQGDMQKLLQEIHKLEKLDHPNIGKVHQMFEDNKRLYFINELMHGGLLFDRISKMQLFSEHDASSVIRQLLSAVVYLNNMGYSHGDIKPSNIFFKSPDENIIKLVDFGTSRRIPANHHLHNVYGNGEYCAPDDINGQKDDKSDAYSIGVLYHVLLVGYAPFEGKKGFELLNAIDQGLKFEGEEWQNITDESKQFISCLLCPKNERFSCEEALQDGTLEFLQSSQMAERKLHIGEGLKNLNEFVQQNSIKQVCLGYMASHLRSLEDQIELEKTFQMMDRNGDGFLSEQELLEGYKEVYGNDFDEQEFIEVFKKADKDSDGKLSYNEWMATAVDQQKYIQIQNLDAAFQDLDVDGNNRITFEELQAILESSDVFDKDSIRAFKEMFNSIDDSNMGQISAKQFRELFMKIMQS